MRLTEKKENGFYELKEGQEIYGEENGIRLVQVIGQYEDIDESPEHMAKIKKALEIIRNIGMLKPYEMSGGQCWLETKCDAAKITKDNYDLLREVLL